MKYSPLLINGNPLMQDELRLIRSSLVHFHAFCCKMLEVEFHQSFYSYRNSANSLLNYFDHELVLMDRKVLSEVLGPRRCEQYVSLEDGRSFDQVITQTLRMALSNVQLDTSLAFLPQERVMIESILLRLLQLKKDHHATGHSTSHGHTARTLERTSC